MLNSFETRDVGSNTRIIHAIQSVFYVCFPCSFENSSSSTNLGFSFSIEVQPHEIPKGAGPHFTQPIIDAQEEMYFNKTETIQKLIDANNERDRERKREGNRPKQ